MMDPRNTRLRRPNPPRLNDTQALATKPVSQDPHWDLNDYPFALKTRLMRRHMDTGKFAPNPVDSPSDLKTACGYLRQIKGDYC